jgi:predicted nucleic acid-binding protein
MDLTVDTSVLIAVLTSEPERAKLIAITAGVDLLAPMSVHWEVGNALSGMLRRKRITTQQASMIVAAYQQIPIRQMDVSLKESVRIAAELNLYAYDAYLIVCARTNRTGLISLDKGLLDAARKAGVETLEV